MPASVNSASPTFSITAGTQSGSTPQDYLFNVAGKGGDPAGNIRQQALRLRVVDFAMSAASPASVSMPPSEISQPVNVQLIPLGSFDQPVTLSCAGLPAGTTCSFNGVSAPAVITPSGSPRPVAVTVITSSSTPAGNSTVTISAATAGRPNGAVTQPFMLTVTAATGSTDLSVADGAVQPPTKVDPVGQPLAPPMTFTVTNNGSAVTNANLYVNFAEPVFVDPSTDASCTGAGTITAAISCTIGSMQATDSHSISVVVVPGFTRTVNASAVVNSELGDSDLSNNTAAIIRNVRPRPWTRVPAKLP
jgi:hypothetical protein